VFISYAWESEPHASWVRELATRLRTHDGLDVTLDQWAAQPGDELTLFMEQGVRASDFVLLVCTPMYKRKFDARRGGVGYEAKNIAGEISAGLALRKIIPIQRSGEWAESAPSIVLGDYYVDLRGEPYEERAYQRLVDALHGQRLIAPPIARKLGLEPRTSADANLPAAIVVTTQEQLYAWRDCLARLAPHPNEMNALAATVGLRFATSAEATPADHAWRDLLRQAQNQQLDLRPLVALALQAAPDDPQLAALAGLK